MKNWKISLIISGVAAAAVMMLVLLAAAQDDSTAFLPLVQKPEPTPTYTPTPESCPEGPEPTADLSAEPTDLHIGQTTELAFSTNLGIPHYNLYANGDTIAIFSGVGSSIGVFDVRNESKAIKMINNVYPPILEARQTGEIRLTIAVNGETYGFSEYNGECHRFWYFTNAGAEETLTVADAAPAQE